MKKEISKKEEQKVKYPIVKDGRFVCSDGTSYSDGYFAELHEQSLKQ